MACCLSTAPSRFLHPSSSGPPDDFGSVVHSTAGNLLPDACPRDLKEHDEQEFNHVVIAKRLPLPRRLFNRMKVQRNSLWQRRKLQIHATPPILLRPSNRRQILSADSM
ncbi:hypothetical protein O6H91_13G021800 [Diphasiastrum complanatum]|uniref:Uncharacterized protein n=1 Tax=Diphasiastrum complanatum TaxID=34168 RepID=A0ACC2BSV9_DIPCM|nr:hypothetical protein O6H91_13G021800 [Diphasiastrum complanatum]